AAAGRTQSTYTCVTGPSGMVWVMEPPVAVYPGPFVSRLKSSRAPSHDSRKRLVTVTESEARVPAFGPLHAGVRGSVGELLSPPDLCSGPGVIVVPETRKMRNVRRSITDCSPRLNGCAV